MHLPEISVIAAHERLAVSAPPRLIDVREEDEFAFARIPGAELLPLSLWPGIVAEKLTDPAEPLLLVCHHGGRSAQATAFLLQNGFTDVTNVAGGIDAWSQEIAPSIPRY
ncbi:MAG: rhodanese [Chthoniobacter sp.]|nr:rhodanese [Chthoniobacter sp.]